MAADEEDTEIGDETPFCDKLDRFVYKSRFAEAISLIDKGFAEYLSSEQRDRFEELKIICLCAEVYDYFGRYTKARALLVTIGPSALSCLSDFISGSIVVEGVQREIKQQVWVAIHWANGHYRRHQYEQTVPILNICGRALEKLGFVSGLTKARVLYMRGLVYRQLHQYSEAKENFTAAIQAAYVAKNLRQGYQSMARDLLIAKCLGLGLGWVCYTESSLKMAIPFLLSARVHLNETEAHLISGYVDVIDACVHRAVNSDKGDEVTLVISKLERAYRLFVEAGHRDYAARAANELAVAHVSRAMIVRRRMDSSPPRSPEVTAFDVSAFRASLCTAEGYAKEVDDSTEGYDLRTKCTAWIILSRIERLRGDFTKALSYAAEAINMGSDKDALFTLIDAFIARGEVLREQGHAEDAIASFSSALERGGINPKVRAVCHIQIARACLDHGDIRGAESHWGEWLRVRDVIETGFVCSLAREVEARMLASNEDFRISFLSAGLRPSDEEKRLHAFLARWARYHGITEAGAIRKLGKSRATYYNWLNGYRPTI